MPEPVNKDKSVPPYPGLWVRREDLPNGLNTTRNLADICYYSPERRQWESGITSEAGVMYFVRVSLDVPTEVAHA